MLCYKYLKQRQRQRQRQRQKQSIRSLSISKKTRTLLSSILIFHNLILKRFSLASAYMSMINSCDLRKKRKKKKKEEKEKEKKKERNIEDIHRN